MVQRIRATKAIISPLYGCFLAGTVISVPEQVDAVTAASWLKGHLAQEDKMLDGPAETKARGRRKKCPTS